MKFMKKKQTEDIEMQPELSKKQKVWSRLYATGFILLAVLLAVMTLLPSLTLYRPDLDYADGRFTEDAMALDSVQVGLDTVFTVIKEFDDISLVFTIESNDNIMDNILEEIDTKAGRLQAYVDMQLENGYTMESLENDSKYQSLAAEVAEVIERSDNAREQNEKLLSELTEEDYARIEDKMRNDEDFVSVFAFLQTLGFLGGSEEFSDDDIVGQLRFVTCFILLLGTIAIAAVSPVIVAICLLVQLILFFTNLKKANVNKTDRRMNWGFPFFIYPILIMLPVALFEIVSPVKGLSVGIGVKGACIVALLSVLLRAVKAIVCAGKSKVRVIVKQVLSIASAVIVLVFLMNFSGGFMLQGIQEDSMVFEATYDAELREQQNDEAATDAVTAVVLNTIFIFMFTVYALVFTVVTFEASIKRVGFQKIKSKKGTVDGHLPLIALGVLLLITAILPVAFNASSHDAKIASYEKGIYKTCYNEYLEEGTFAKTAYDTLKEQRELGVKTVDELTVITESSVGTDSEKYKHELIRAQVALAEIEQNINDIETKQSKATMCVIMALLYIVVEILYMLVNKVIPEKEDTAPEEKQEEAQTDAVQA